MKAYLESRYSSTQLFTKEYLQAELLISAKEARELQERVIGNLKPMSFSALVSCIEYALEHENEVQISHYRRHIA